ncbi:helix-turn-helix domain-containing protein [Brevibacillus humidisoli]|uniref:winged helix-turn-helix domain-containing protein n=1 Tax=Brevibacillus humidisoli TaxID=2895522 RepID=UPI001E299F54|nr:helix-turn-helix domain-containing protein [Brevibacillus humidisoli]UFJ40879.1 helix-turn-helix domain-containing protein [Brevibacillus humidisoli]
MKEQIAETYFVESAEQAMTLLHPLRAEMLSRLTEPASATELARGLNETPQRINYHLKTLEKVGLARRVGTRQVRNLVEVLYQAIARTFVLSESLGLAPEMMQRLKDQSALSHLVAASERIKRDALLLLERSEQQEEVPSATLHTKVHLPDHDARQAFVEEYVSLVKQLAEKYQASGADSEPYSVVLAVYPEPRKGADQS